MDALVGAVLGGVYRITGLIGEGGMGAVYEAVQLRLNKRVAVKLMARDLAANREALARFHREAEITSRLGHPHLVSVVDFGQAESGEPYLVMEYLEGEDLDHRLRRVGRMPIEAVAHVVKQVASALSAAHGQGVVHRDLKPGNIFLVQIPGEPDFAKVLDFGISKMKAARTQLTNASAVMGTPNYMSPEQATGMVEEVDHRTDQWALACIAWRRSPQTAAQRSRPARRRKASTTWDFKRMFIGVITVSATASRRFVVIVYIAMYDDSGTPKNDTRIAGLRDVLPALRKGPDWTDRNGEGKVTWINIPQVWRLRKASLR
jgi:serine/threonine protein kinase